MTIVSCYALKGIFNVDQFRLFYPVLPSKTMHFKSQKCSGGKHSKVCLTGLAVDNTFKERLSMFIVRKSQNPRCFNGVKHLPYRYRSQLKSWMSISYLKNGFENSTESLMSKREKSH